MQHQLAAYIQLKAGVILELFSLFLSGLKSAQLVYNIKDSLYSRYCRHKKAPEIIYCVLDTDEINYPIPFVKKVQFGKIPSVHFDTQYTTGTERDTCTLSFSCTK